MKWIYAEYDTLVNLENTLSIRLCWHSDGECDIRAYHSADNNTVLFCGTKEECVERLANYAQALAMDKNPELWRTVYRAEQAIEESQKSRCKEKDPHGVQCDLPGGHNGEHCFIPF